MKPAALLHTSTLELLSLWADLVTAYHGVNSFGANVAEIYAYRFGYSPTDELNSFKHEAALLKARGLLELLNLFKSEYSCSIFVDGKSPLALQRDGFGTTTGFDHRVHVEVRRK